MKKLLPILFILFSFVGFGQNNGFPSKPHQSNNKTSNIFDSQVTGASGISGAIFSDTTTANSTAYVKGKSFNIIHTTNDNNTWYRSSDTLRWVLFGTSSTNCLGTHLINGSITWSGTGYVFDATLINYEIICGIYQTQPTTVTLTASNPSLDRIDVIYVDIFQNVGILTGTPAVNPIKPQVNPLTQLEVSFVYVGAGSTTPTGQSATTIYNENIEWGGSSNVSGINFAYATNPFSGTVSTLVPNAADGQNVTWTNGSPVDISNSEYLKFYIRLNAAFSVDLSRFLSIAFYNGATQSTQVFTVANGTYGFNANLLNQYQLVVIPIVSPFNDFNADRVRFVISGAPASFQLDKVYLLEGATPPSGSGIDWKIGGNMLNGIRPNNIGTLDKNPFAIITTGVERGIFPEDSIAVSTDTTDWIIGLPREGRPFFNKRKVPVILADSPLYIHPVTFKDHISVDTTYTHPNALVNYAYLNSHLGGSGWGLTGNSISSGNFLGTTNDQDLVFKRNNLEVGRVGVTSTALGSQSLIALTGINNSTAIGDHSQNRNLTGVGNVSVGQNSLYLNTTSNYNTAIGEEALESTTGGSNAGIGRRVLYNNTTGFGNTAIGEQSLITSITGSNNTAIGIGTDITTSSTKNSIALGHLAVASDSTFVISPDIKQIKATGLTYVPLDTSANAVMVLNKTTGIMQPSYWPSSVGSPAGNYGNVPVIRNSQLEAPAGDSLNFVSGDGLYSIGNITAWDGSNRSFFTNSTNFNGGFGDLDGVSSGYKYTINQTDGSVLTGNFNNTISTSFTVKSSTIPSGMIMAGDNGTVNLADWNGDVNGTGAVISPPAQTITMNALNGYIFDGGNFKVSNYGAGAITSDGSGNWTSVSDRRAKHNIIPFNYGLSSINKLKTSSFIYNKDTSNTLMSGFIAQDVQAVIPIGVHKGKDGLLSLETNAVLAASVNAIKELSDKIDKLQTKVDAQSKEIKKLKHTPIKHKKNVHSKQH